MKLWFLDWNLEEKHAADWDDEARPYLENFVMVTKKTGGFLSRLLGRRQQPTWTEEDFQELLFTLGCAGLGWLRPQGVRRELEKMAADWKGPPFV